MSYFILQDFDLDTLLKTQCGPLEIDDIAYTEKGISDALDFCLMESVKRRERWSFKKINDSMMMTGRFYFKSYEETFAFVSAIYLIGLSQSYYPDVTFGEGFVYVTLYTIKLGGIHKNDLIMVAKIEELLEEDDEEQK